MSFFKNEGIGIAGISCSVPDNLVTVDSFKSIFGEEIPTKFTAGTGIQSMYKALPNQTASDLAVAAAQDLFSHIDIKPTDIGAMMMVTQSPDYRRPSSASVIQKRLSLPIECTCMEMNLGCSGFVYGMQSLMALMNSSEIDYALLLMGDTASKLVDSRDKSIVMMYGDAGAAVLLSRQNGIRSNALLRSDGNRFNAIVLPAGGFRDMSPEHDRFVCSDGIERSLYDIFMDGTSVFSFSITDVPQALDDFLELSNMGINDYDTFVFHQANQFIIKQLIRKLKIPKEKTLISLDRFGNTGGVSIPLTLCDKFGEINQGRKKALLCGFGIGLSWGVINAVIDTNTVFPIIKTKDYYAEGKFIPGEY